MNLTRSCAVLILFGLFLVLVCTAAADTYFEEIADVPAKLNLPTAATVVDDIYLVSGWDLATGWTRKMYRYNIPTDTWSTDTPDKAALPNIGTARSEACNTGYIDQYGMFCVIGGNEGDGAAWIGPTDSVECYDPVTNLWSTLGTLPKALTGVFCSAFEGVIYVTGGTNGSTDNTDLFWLDTAAKTAVWNTAPSSRPIGSAFGGAAITRDPALVEKADAEYRFSQFMGNAVSSTHYGLISQSWSNATDNEKRGYTCIIPDGDFNTLFIGGSDFTTAQPYDTFDDVVAYNSIDDTWQTATATLPLSRGAMACAQDDQGNIYLFAGYSSDDSKDLDLGRKFKACRFSMEPLNSTFWNDSWLYLAQNAWCGNWGNAMFFLYLWGSAGAEPMPADDVDVAENGAMRVRLSFDTSFVGPARIRARLADTGRVGTADIQVTDEPEPKDKNIFYEGFDNLRIGVRINWDENRWDVEGDRPFQFGVRISFKGADKDGEGNILEAEDTEEAETGQIWSAIYPIEKGTFTYKWDAYFEDGDGLSMALYDDVVDELSHGLLVNMLEGAVTVQTPDAKAETDCSLAITTGQWYAFSFELNLDAGQGTLSVDGAATACAALTVPFGASAPVQGLGFVLPDDLVGGTTYIDNIEVLGFEDPPPPADDDDDDGGDDDDDDGCCGC